MENEIRIRPLEKDDIPFMHKLYNQKSIMDYWFLEAYYPQDRITSGYEQMKESDRHRRFVICKDEENIGLTGLYDIEPIHRNTKFGIMMDPAYQGKGYATKATEMMADYAFRILNLHKVKLPSVGVFSIPH
ncbi:hypothetical protein GCM10008986_07950 [Salinibacillus aidingensis]|uniref:N-acetyltransferase domain-containing protein n=1 Tax=Salinibacillus aidingensis TaxID=237684 RepID=A0ABN1AW49_9BACI